MKKIENFVEYLESPSLNGIIFPNGVIKILDVSIEWKPRLRYSIKEKEVSSIDILASKGNLYWNDCAVIAKLIDEKESIEVISGEGDYGSDGFVAIIDLNTRKLKWLAFFNCSNPFNELEVKGEEIHVSSTMGCLWKFNLKNPVDFSVECH